MVDLVYARVVLVEQWMESIWAGKGVEWDSHLHEM